MYTFSTRSLGLFVCLKRLLLAVTLRHKVQKLHVAEQAISCAFLNTRNGQVTVPHWQTEDLGFKGKGVLVIYGSLAGWSCWRLGSEGRCMPWVCHVSLRCIRNRNNWEPLQLPFLIQPQTREEGRLSAGGCGGRTGET